MASLTDPDVIALLDPANCGVISTHNPDGSILSTVVWQGVEDGVLKVNSAVGRKWPTNLERDPHATVAVVSPENPFWYVEVRGTATGTTQGADDHIDRLAKKYLGQDKYPFRQPGEQRITYTITPSIVRLVKQ